MPTDTRSTIRKGATKKEQAEKCSQENTGTCNSNTTTASTHRREPLCVRQDNQYGLLQPGVSLLIILKRL